MDKLVKLSTCTEFERSCVVCELFVCRDCGVCVVQLDTQFDVDFNGRHCLRQTTSFCLKPGRFLSDRYFLGNTHGLGVV